MIDNEKKTPRSTHAKNADDTNIVKDYCAHDAYQATGPVLRRKAPASARAGPERWLATTDLALGRRFVETTGRGFALGGAKQASVTRDKAVRGRA